MVRPRNVHEKREVSSYLYTFAKHLEQQVECRRGAVKDPKTFLQLFASGVANHWLLRFLDVAHERWHAQLQKPNGFQKQNEPLEWWSRSRIIQPTMASINDFSQSHGWNRQLREDIDIYINKFGEVKVDSEPRFESMQTTDLWPTQDIGCDSRTKLFLARSYVPKAIEVGLVLSFGGLPRRFCDPNLVSHPETGSDRSQISFSPERSAPGTFDHFVRTYLPWNLPRSLVEDFDQFLSSSARLGRIRPSVIFTANLHLASDTFLIWTCLERMRGSRVVLSQHGGLYGQGVIPTREAEFEQWFADTYFHWGWCSAPNAVKVPAQITMWKRKRRKSNRHNQLVLVTDCTYRYSRRPWPCDEENRCYRSMLLSSYGSIPSRLVGNVIVRLHHDHDKYDDSHSEMWRNAYPTVRLDDGLGPIDKLRKRARLMVSMSLGTSEIEQFARNIPTILRIDPVIHAVRDSCVELFSDMEIVGLVHWSDESFSDFLDKNWDDIDAWWTSTSVRDVVARYLDQFGYQSKKPLREFRAALKAAAAV